LRLDIKHMLESKMALQKANAEIIRMNLKTNVVTKRKKDGNFFYAKEKGEILEANPHTSNKVESYKVCNQQLAQQIELV